MSYIFNADSNFGMHKRDYNIALKLVETKENMGTQKGLGLVGGKTQAREFSRLRLYCNTTIWTRV